MRPSLPVSLLLLLAACAPVAVEHAGEVSVAVAPLSLPGIDDACYKLAVKNSAGDLLWSQAGICSDAYGDGRGSITYIGTCDATLNDNVVELTLESLLDAAGTPITGYDNPCPAGAPCARTVTCQENADVPVEFNLTVLFKSHQGFFDVLVNTEVISCSAKADCSGDLLADPQTGERVPGETIALSCAAPDGSPMHLYMTDVQLQCTGGQGYGVSLDPTAGPGNHYAPGAAPAGVRQAATHFVTSSVAAGASPSSNVSVAVTVAPDFAALGGTGATSCRLLAKATVSATPLVGSNGFVAPAGAPVVTFDVEIAKNGPGGFMQQCTANPLGSTGVSASYAAPGDNTMFPHHFSGQ